MLKSLNVAPQDHEGWLTFERRNWIALTFLAFFAGYGAGNGHTTQNAISDVSEQLGQQKKAAVVAVKAAGCEHHLARVASDVAKQAILSAQAANAEAPDPSAIPQDNCPSPEKILTQQK